MYDYDRMTLNIIAETRVKEKWNMDNGKNMSIAGLVCGIIGIVGFIFSWVPYLGIITFVLSLLGIIFGVKGRKLADPNNTGLATAGMVLGIIGVSLGAIGLICNICTVCATCAAASTYGGLNDLYKALS